MFSLRTQLLAQTVKVHAGKLEVGLQIQTLHSHAVLVVAHKIVGFFCEHNLRNVGLQLLDQRIDQLFLELVLGSLFVSLLDFCPYVGAIFSKGIKFRNVFCKLIVSSGQLGLLNTVQLYLEYGSLASQVLCVIVSREGNVNVKFITDGVANNLILKAGDKLAGAKLQIKLFGLAAVKRYTVNRTVKINVNAILQLGSTVSYVNNARVALARPTSSRAYVNLSILFV